MVSIAARVWFEQSRNVLPIPHASNFVRVNNIGQSFLFTVIIVVKYLRFSSGRRSLPARSIISLYLSIYLQWNVRQSSVSLRNARCSMRFVKHLCI